MRNTCSQSLTVESAAYPADCMPSHEEPRPQVEGCSGAGIFPPAGGVAASAAGGATAAAGAAAPPSTAAGADMAGAEAAAATAAAAGSGGLESLVPPEPGYTYASTDGCFGPYPCTLQVQTQTPRERQIRFGPGQQLCAPEFI